MARTPLTLGILLMLAPIAFALGATPASACDDLAHGCRVNCPVTVNTDVCHAANSSLTLVVQGVRATVSMAVPDADSDGAAHRGDAGNIAFTFTDYDGDAETHAVVDLVVAFPPSPSMAWDLHGQPDGSVTQSAQFRAEDGVLNLEFPFHVAQDANLALAEVHFTVDASEPSGGDNGYGEFAFLVVATSGDGGIPALGWVPAAFLLAVAALVARRR